MLVDVVDQELTKSASQAEAFQQVWDNYGRIDVLCANAGIVDKR